MMSSTTSVLRHARLRLSHHFAHVYVHAALYRRWPEAHPASSRKTGALNAPGVRRNHVKFANSMPEMFHQDRRAIQMIHGYVEISPELRRVQIQCEHGWRRVSSKSATALAEMDSRGLSLRSCRASAVIRQHRGDTPREPSDASIISSNSSRWYPLERHRLHRQKRPLRQHFPESGNNLAVAKRPSRACPAARPNGGRCFPPELDSRP